MQDEEGDANRKACGYLAGRARLNEDDDTCGGAGFGWGGATGLLITSLLEAVSGAAALPTNHLG